MSKAARLPRITALCAATALLLWVLPLGAFIRPSQEKTVCGGKRAFHMCSSMSGASVSTAPSTEAVSYTNASSEAQKGARSAGGASEDLLLDLIRSVAERQSARALVRDALAPLSPERSLREPIPIR